MTDAQLIEAAAKRYGLTDPSPDDLLSQRWPAYNHDALHTAGYHRMYELVMKRVDALHHGVRCRRCGDRLENANANRRWCDDCADKNRGNWRKRYGAPLEGERANQAIALYLGGLSVKAVAQRVGAGQNKIRATLRAHNVERRGYRNGDHGVTVGRAAA